MSARACAATHFMGGNGHFVSRRSKSSSRDIVCNPTNLSLQRSNGPVGGAPGDLRGFARLSAHGEVLDR